MQRPPGNGSSPGDSYLHNDHSPPDCSSASSNSTAFGDGRGSIHARHG